jgi:AcrR family transcriptional regulator
MSTYHHGDLPAALLRTAGKMLEKDGPAELSLREVARRAGVSHNAPYRHFPDRDALLAGLAAEGFRMLGEALQAAGTREMGEAYVRFALEHPQRFRLMFGGHVDQAQHAELGRSARRAYDTLSAVFRARTDVADPEQAAAAAWALVHGLAHLLLDGHFPGKKTDRFVRAVLDAVRFDTVKRSG